MYTILLKDNIIYWLSAFPVAALSMLPSPSFSLHFLLVVSQGQDLSLRRRSWPCCIFFERTECLKKKTRYWGWKLKIGYWFLYVLLSKSVWPSGPMGSFCLEHSISPTHATTDTRGVMLGLVQAWVQLYTDIYAYLYIIKDVRYQKSIVKMVQLWALCLCKMLTWPMVHVVWKSCAHLWICSLLLRCQIIDRFWTSFSAEDSWWIMGVCLRILPEFWV